jgi:hypothetical protein
MPTHVVAQCSYAQDSALTRDRYVINPCFRWANLTIQDAQSLANNVLDAIEAKYASPKTTHSICKIYDLEGSKPVLPMATVERHIGGLTTSVTPRELSLCLSFKGSPGSPRHRGRLYIPCTWLTIDPGIRPTTITQQDTLDLAQHLYDVGGANVDWIVWSRVGRFATGVTEAWVDDEWDIQRRRGLRPTTRLTKPF